MKTQPVKVATQCAKKCLSALPSPICALLVSLFIVTSRQALAQGVNAVWLQNPPGIPGDWNDGANWSNQFGTNDPPDEFPDTAAFNTSTVTSLFLSINTGVESITFNSGASAFTINTNGNTLTLEGPGIVNNSGQTQTIINNGGSVDTASGLTAFTNTATAGNLVIFNNSALDSFGLEGETEFYNNSSAGSATITNNGGTVTSALGGSTEFFNTSSAGNATIITNGGTNGGQGGTTSFSDSSSAGNATIITNGGTSGGTGGITFFLGSSDGGTARAITNGNGSFDISGLTSSGMGIGSIEGSGNYFLGSKTLTVGSNNLSTAVSGIIQDGGLFGGSGGSLIKVGSGTLILAGDNTYTGGTTINAGTLQLGDGGTTGSIIGDVTDNGTLIFNRFDDITFGGAITGTGNVVKLGGNTLTLTGINTYTGTTTVNAGVLQAGSTGAFSSASAFTVSAGATLDLNGFDNTVGSLSGSGVVTNNSGASPAASPSPTPPMPVNATLSVGADNTSTTFAGTLQDGPVSTLALDKVGTGTFTLSGTNTYTGTTTVDDGSLIVDGSIASTQTVVNPSGFLGGSGFIGGNVVNSGTVSPGNPVGTLTIAGDYNQTSAGTLHIAVSGLSPGQFSQLVVNGHAALAGTLNVTSLSNFKFQVGNTLTVLTANNGVSGTFSGIQNPFISDTIVKAQVVVLPGGVEITGTQGSFTTAPGVATTPNVSAVAKALDSAAGDPRAAPLFAFLNSQPLANLPHDLSLIAPTQVSSMNATTVSLGKVQASNVGGHLGAVRAGLTGFSSAGFAINGGAASFDEGFAGVNGPEGKAVSPVFAPTPENRWGVFVTGTGEFTNVDSTPNAAGYNVDTGGITLGVDYRLTPNFVIGFDGGYAHTNVSIAGGGGNIDINAGSIGLYATLFGNGFYLDTAVSGGPSGYDTHRTGLQGSATGSTDGGNIDFLISGGYDWKRGNLSIGPTATFQFSYVSLNGFTETGSLAPLKFPDQNYESERTIFGAKAAYIWKIGQITLLPQISVGWVHEYGSTAYSVVANFANGAGNSFTVVGPEIGRDGVLVSAGVSAVWTDRISTYIYYNGELARTNYDSHTVTGGVRISF